MPKRPVGSNESQQEEKPSQKRSKTFASGIGAKNVKKLIVKGDVNVVAGGNKASTKTKNSRLCDGRMDELDSPSLFCDVWMNNRNANVIVILCKNAKALKQAEKRLKVDHKRINRSVPAEVVAERGGLLHFQLTFEKPLNITVDPKEEQLSLTRAVFNKTYHELRFEVQSPSGQLHFGDECKICLKIDSHSNVGSKVDKRFVKSDFEWPVGEKPRASKFIRLPKNIE